MRELLIRYLLGELDADERRDLQAQLRSDPELRAELEKLRSCFAASSDEDLFAPDAPSGLAERTAGLVKDSESGMVRRPGGTLSQVSEAPAGFLGWSLADLTVAGGVMLAVSMLIFPALRNSRDGTRRTVCQDHLRQVAVLVGSYSQNHGGSIPQVGANERAGMFAIHLIAEGHTFPTELAELLVCPGSPVAAQMRAGTYKIQLPNAEQIRRMSREELSAVAANASPCYNYCLPYVIAGKYFMVRDTNRRMSPVLSDAGGDEHADPMSPNHGRRVVQVQYADGSVQLLTSVKLPGLNDDMYHNDRGKVAAGLRPLDTVLAPSDATPAGEDVEGAEATGDEQK